MTILRTTGAAVSGARLAALAVFLPLALGGCKSVSGGGPAGSRGGGAGSSRACLADHARFDEAWACARARLAAHPGEDARRDGLVEEGDILARDVKAGKVSEAAARQRLDAGLAREAGR